MSHSGIIAAMTLKLFKYIDRKLNYESFFMVQRREVCKRGQQGRSLVLGEAKSLVRQVTSRFNMDWPIVPSFGLDE